MDLSDEQQGKQLAKHEPDLTEYIKQDLSSYYTAQDISQHLKDCGIKPKSTKKLTLQQIVDHELYSFCVHGGYYELDRKE